MARIPKQRVIFDAEKYDLDYLRETRDSYSPITDADFEDSISYDMGEHDLQRLVGGNIEPFDVIFGEGISLYVNEEGLFTCPPNRAVYATKGMEEAGYLSMMDYSSPVKEGELYSILCGDLVAVGFDFETGENRDLSADEMSRVADYFTEVSKPGSGIEEVIAIRTGQRREEARSEDGRVTLKGEAQASRAASEKLAEGRGTGSPARDDHSIV